MTVAEMQKLVLRRLGEAPDFVTALTPSMTDLATVLDELQRAYEEAVEILADNNFYMVQTSEDIAYSIGDKEKNLWPSTRTVPATGDLSGTSEVRKVLFVGIYPANDTTKNPRRAVFPYRDGFAEPATIGAGGLRGKTLMMYQRGQKLGFYQTLTAAQTVQVRYAPAVETLATNAPIQVPDAHHRFIAQKAAVEIAKAEEGDWVSLDRELERLYERLVNVAGSYDKIGTKVIGSFTGRY